MKNYLISVWLRVSASVFLGLALIAGGIYTVQGKSINLDHSYNVSAFGNGNGAVKLIKDQASGKTFSTDNAAACTYTLSVTSVNIPTSGGSGSVTVTTGEGCPWSVTSNVPWIIANLNATGTGTLTINVPGNNGVARTGTLNVAGQLFTVNQTDTITPTIANRALYDFDGDNKTDFSIYRPALGEWWYHRSSDGGHAAFQFGVATDVITPGDFTGDGKTDGAFYRPSQGFWYILRSEDYSYYAFPFGLAEDIPVAADYDGDGKTDAAVYRPSETKWYILKSTGGVTQTVFGEPGSIPVPADYMGDSAPELSYYNPATGVYRFKYNDTIVSAAFQANANNKAVPVDLSGDEKAEMAIFNQGGWTWAVNGGVLFTQFGSAGDIPAVGDYDGDARTDLAIYRPSTSTWWYRATSQGLQHKAMQFGISTDKPVPSAPVR